MTNEEMLNILRHERTEIKDRRGADFSGVEALDIAIKALEQTRWIPVSERLPEDEQYCLIAYEGMGKFHIKIATYSTNLCKVDKYDFHTKKDISGFYGFDTEYGYYEWSDVVAWMPLPQPYKGEGEDENDDT